MAPRLRQVPRAEATAKPVLQAYNLLFYLLALLVVAASLTLEGPATEDYFRLIGTRLQGDYSRCFRSW